MCTLYSNPNKLEKEQSFFETFRSARTDLHIRNPRRGKPPEPDYLFSISQKKIGLEVTSPVKELLAPLRTDQDKCLKKACQIAKQIGLETVEVKVQFRSDHDTRRISLPQSNLSRYFGLTSGLTQAISLGNPPSRTLLISKAPFSLTVFTDRVEVKAQ